MRMLSQIEYDSLCKARNLLTELLKTKRELLQEIKEGHILHKPLQIEVEILEKYEHETKTVG